MTRWKKALLAIVVLIAAAAAVVVWRSSVARRDARLDPGWEAIVRVLAGDGIAEFRDGSRPRFSDPFGVAVGPDGSIYVSDAGDAQRIRRFSSEGTVWTVAGGGIGYADGPGNQARFNTPSGIAIDAEGEIYVADTGNNKVRRIGRDGRVWTVAGGLSPGHVDGVGVQARFNGPIGLAVAAGGRIVVADTYNDVIRAIDVDGSVVTIAGAGQPGAVDGPSSEARFDTPCGVAVDSAGNIFVADTGNDAVRMISADGFVSTVGPPPPYGLVRPVGIAVSADGHLYVTDDRGRIVEISPGVSARVIAGSRPGFEEGSGAAARFRRPAGIALAAPGRLIVADARNALVRMVAAASRVGLVPPASSLVKPAFDPDAFGSEPLLWPLEPMHGPFEVTGTLGEARGGEGTERFHAGLDVHAPVGVPVRAIRAGVVSQPLAASDFGTLNESLRIGPLAYVHIRVGRRSDGEVLDEDRFLPEYDETGRVSRLRVKRGTRFAAGDAIGTVNPFSHVHLNVGWPGEEYNPLRFRLMHFVDTVPPRIARGGITLIAEDGQALKARRRGRLLVHGRVQIVVDAWDQANGNAPRRRLGLYRLGYQVLQRNGTPVTGFESPVETIRFDRLSTDDLAPRAVFASGSGIPWFGARRTRFLYAVTTTLREGTATPGAWDTGTLAPGDYTLRVLAADFNGNEAVAGRDLPIEVVEAAEANR